MRKRILIYTIILLLYYNYNYAQNGSIFGEINYNSFAHSSLKSFQEEFIKDIPDLPVQVTDNFPANIGFTLGYTINSINTSIFFSYNTTGGKISYSDYSGLLRITEPLKGYTVGGNYLINISKKENKKFQLGLKAFYTLSTLKIESFSRLLEETTENTVSFKSTDIGVGVNFIYEYPISFFKLRASIGADLVLGGKLLLDKNRELHLEDNSRSPVRTSWSGIRTGLGVSIPLAF